MPRSHVGAFNIGTGAATTTKAVTGVGFQPKVVLFWVMSGRTESTDAISQTNVRKGFGYAISTSDRCASSARSVDGAANANCAAGNFNGACIVSNTGAAAVDGRADLQSMDSDGFTLVIDDQFPEDLRIGYLALGGGDLTNYVGGTITEPAATGNQDITSVGFQPDAVIFFAGQADAGSQYNVDSRFMIGAAAGATPTNAVTSGGSNDAAATTQTIHHQSDDYCIALCDGTVTSLNGRASLTAWLSNGFRLNWAERNSTREIFYLALKGGNYKLGTITTLPAASGTVSATGFGFLTTGVLLCSGGDVLYTSEDSGDSVGNDDFLQIGGFSGPSARNATNYFDADGGANSACVSAVEHDHCWIATAGSTVFVYGLDCQSIDADGFTLDCDLDSVGVGPTSGFLWYLAFGTPVIRPTGVASAEAFGTAKVNGKIHPTGIATAEAHGTTKVVGVIKPTGIATAAAFGTAKVNGWIHASAIASAEAFGTPTLIGNIVATGIASAEAFGTHKVNGWIHVTSIASAEAFGTPAFNGYIVPTAIPSAEAFGTALLIGYITPTAIASAEAFGTPRLVGFIHPVSIASLEAFGTPSLRGFIHPAGIASLEAFGTPQLNATIIVTGIPSAEFFGIPYLPREVFIRPMYRRHLADPPRLIVAVEPACPASVQYLDSWPRMSVDEAAQPRVVNYTDCPPRMTVSAESETRPNIYQKHLACPPRLNVSDELADEPRMNVPANTDRPALGDGPTQNANVPREAHRRTIRYPDTTSPYPPGD